MMVAAKYGEATMRNDLWQKDMKIIGEFATRLGVPTPLFSASAAIYNAPPSGNQPANRVRKCRSAFPICDSTVLTEIPSVLAISA